MITMRQSSPPETSHVEFDPYVPLTITWSSATALLDQPGYVVLQDANGYLELKFHPHTGTLIEAVLTAAPGIHPEQHNLAPRATDLADLMPYLDPEDSLPALDGRLVIRAHPDYLYVSFGPDPTHWAGQHPVLFGFTEDQTLTTIAARWSTTERESVLGSR